MRVVIPVKYYQGRMIEDGTRFIFTIIVKIKREGTHGQEPNHEYEILYCADLDFTRFYC